MTFSFFTIKPEVIKINIENVELRINYLTEIITYVLKHYAEEEGLSSAEADEIAREATDLFLNLYRQKRKEGKPFGCSFVSIAKDAVLLTIRKRGIPIRNNKATFRLLKSVGGEVPYSPIPYIEWLSYKLRLTNEIKEKAKEIAKSYRSKTFRRQAPRVVAASVIYLACLILGQPKTQKEIAKLAHCTDVAIRNNYVDIARRLGIPLTKPLI